MAEQPTGNAGEALVRSFPLAVVAWPQELPAVLDTSTLRDCYRGCLLWGAVGDALGFPVEGWRPAAPCARFRGCDHAGRVCYCSPASASRSK
jgi:hypothetical protein